jgi:hypothetical protein
MSFATEFDWRHSRDASAPSKIAATPGEETRCSHVFNDRDMLSCRFLQKVAFSETATASLGAAMVNS